jgi:outer membrane receptor protein involved in Fe transport
MNYSAQGRLGAAIRLAFLGGAVGAVASPAADAQDSSNVQQLQGVQVTGSLIRRVDTETSNPVTVVSRKSIEDSGVTTLGQLLEQLPQLTGDALTPQVNNGGLSNGASTLSLRGLGSARTLTLLDGKRLNNNDVNSIPINMIERVEVLNEGAGTVYGSDAIGGVVNFITRKSFKGTDVEASFGETTDHGDAQKSNFSLTSGFANSSGHAVYGLSYDRTGSIKGPARTDSANALAIIYNTVVANGSSRIPTGLFTFTEPTASVPSNLSGCATAITGTTNSTVQATRNPAATGAGGLSDYECRSALKTLTPSQYSYNYQTENLVSIPADRIHLFALGESHLSEDVSLYGSGLYTNTKGRSQLAPEAFDSSSLTNPQGQALSIPISQYSQYNPFGEDITAYKFRAVQTGDRGTKVDEGTFQGTAGIKATLLDRFNWDSSFTYGKYNGTGTSYGYINISGLAQQLGPSKNGVCYTDGTYSTPIANCTPVNLTGTYGNTYSNLSVPVTGYLRYSLAEANSNISGDLIQLPAGALSGAAGVEYRSYHYTDMPDGLAQEFDLSESNGGETNGSYDVKEVYAEILVPIVKDLPGFSSLNVDLGTRYSKYSNFGSTTNNKFALEWKPVKDLLARATYSDIFRAPQVSDLYGAAANSAPAYTDPCNGYMGSATATYPNLPAACQGVATDGSYKQADTQGSVTIKGNPKLGPEDGYTTDFGFVYDPDFFKPLTVSFDYWRYQIRHAINELDLQTALNACAATGTATYCNSGLFVRDASGNVTEGLTEPVNIGTVFTDGFDFGLQLKFPHTAFGGFQFSLNGTYLDKIVTTIPGVSRYSQAGEVGGASDLIGGGFPRLKFTGVLDWTYQNFDVTLRNRFVASERDDGGQDGNGNINGVDASTDGYVGNGGVCGKGGPYIFPASGNPYLCSRSTGYVDYQDVSVTYKSKPLHTDFTVGVNDLFGQGAPIVFTQGPAFNYDASNYDITGRFIYGRFVVHFK